MPSTYDKRGIDVAYYSDTVVVTSVAVTSAIQLLLPANPNRQGFTIYNVPANSLYVRLGQSTNSDTWRIANDSALDMFNPFVYRGAVYGRRNGASTGTVIITEYL
jgi:hypothetical protein